MKQSTIKYKVRYILAIMSVVFGLMACTDTWNAYYGIDQKIGTGADLLTTISADPSLTIFTKMLKKTGYDKILSLSKSFTVFAPVDSVLVGINVETSDSATITQIIENHIAASSIGTPNGGDIRVNMRDNKYIYFKKVGSKYTFGDFELATENRLCANGVLHTIKGVVPFAPNIYQAIGNDTTLSTVYQYLKKYDVRTYDLSKSVYIGVNSKGQKVYDTLWVSINGMLNRMGRIDLEDSVYTTIIPTNNAYQNIFNVYQPYFVIYNATTKLENKDSTNFLTKNAVMNDLIFRGSYGSPSQMPDTLLSTRGARLPKDSLLLSNAGVVNRVVAVSNGYLYVVNQLNESPQFKFYKDVSIEAESSLSRTVGTSSSAYTRNVNTDIFTEPVSNSKYLYLESNTASDEASVTFSCANVLSGAYDIYCVVVPAAAESKTDSTRLSFTMTSRDAAAKLVQKKYPSSTTADYGAANYITSPTHVKEILIVKGFKFPFSNSIDLTLKVSTSVASNETAILSRKVRIDRVLFKPAVK